MPRSSVILAAVFFAALGPGCGTQCDRHPDEPPVVFEDGVTDQSAHVYMSSSNAKDPWEGPWLDFPPGRTLRFPHRLGGLPRDIEYWFAFSPNPLSDNGEGATSGFVTGAGNQGTVESITEDHVDLRNDTCSGVFIMVRIADPILESTPDAGVSGDAAAP
jgi:hypothetical protein